MKQIVTVILIIVVIVSIIWIGFTINQVDQEKQRLEIDLQYRSALLADSFKETIEPNLVNRSDEYLQSIVERFANRERFAGLAVFDNENKIVAISSNLTSAVEEPPLIISSTINEDNINKDYLEHGGKNLYLLAVPLHDNNGVVGALMIAQDADFINARVMEIWKNNLFRLIIQDSVLFLILFLIGRLIIYEPLRKLSESLRSAKTITDTQKINNSQGTSLFQSLFREVSVIKKNLKEAQFAAGEEARLSLEKLDSPWTAERLRQFVKQILTDRQIIVISNREPYIHAKIGKKIDYYIPASGMVTAIEPIMQACGGTWIACGSGDADKLVVDKNDRLQVPPEDPKYFLKRIWLTEQEEKGYYDGFSNEGMWPLFHLAHTRPTFRRQDWEEYEKVNHKFAQAVLTEISHKKKPLVLIQDFHLALLPRIIKKNRPDATIGIFWHIPWISAESFGICPWKKEILHGMLGADLIGFHTQLYCNNFIDSVGKELESLIDYEHFTITRDNHISYVKPFPISIAFSDGYEYQTHEREEELNTKNFLDNIRIKTKYIGVGIDRLDYTKGILERFKAIEIFLRKHPSYVGQLTFIQIAAPSRTQVQKYRDFSEDVEREAERINSLYREKNYIPIVLLKRYHNHEEINQFYKIANLCLVTSLHDGMNLVAKEFVAARNDERGVLILSQFTGASQDLKEAIIVNPYDGEQTAEAIKTALTMPLSDQTRRMKKLRGVVRNYNIYRWSAEFLKAMVNIE